MFNLQYQYSFDDVLIIPAYSQINSRKDVDTSSFNLRLPIISSNMDTVTGARMATALNEYGAGSCLHRFQTIDNNIEQFKQSPSSTYVSVGIGTLELDRAAALKDAGASTFVLDVAHGANDLTVKQTKELLRILSGCNLIVGNFATKKDIEAFNYHLGQTVYAYKVGIGGGSACTTRVVTGCGLPTFSSVVDCAQTGHRIIADGGIRNSGDLSKSLAAGASAVMLGRTLAGTDESPGEVYYSHPDTPERTYPGKVTGALNWKKYRGSASFESYEVQGKVSEHRTPEGEAYLIPYKGPVSAILQGYEAGLRSAMSYVGAATIEEFREKAEFAVVTSSSSRESGAHGKNG